MHHHQLIWKLSDQSFHSSSCLNTMATIQFCTIIKNEVVISTIQIQTKIKWNEAIFLTIKTTATEICTVKMHAVKFRLHFKIKFHAIKFKFHFKIRFHAIKFKFRISTRFSVHTIRSASIRFVNIRFASIRFVNIKFRTFEMTFYTIQFKFCIEINFYAIVLKIHTIKFLRTIKIRIFTIEFEFSSNNKLRMIIKFHISTKNLLFLLLLLLSLRLLRLLLLCSNTAL